MASISVRVNLGNVNGNLQQWMQTFEQRVNDRVQEAGINVQAAAKIACPVGTPESTHKKGYHGGRLRQSISYQRLAPNHCSVGSDVSYAGYVNNGTYKMKARPFLTNAFIDERRAFLADLQTLVNA